mgnify:CR=1 FL=1
MQALAKGGYQVGELAKYKYCKDPIAENITIATLNEEEALQLTAEKLLQDNVVIAEAAFLYNNLFVRVDLLVKTNNQIKLIEVKSKSYSEEVKFINDQNKPASKWVPYLYDLAFQKVGSIFKLILRPTIPVFLLLAFCFRALIGECS